MRAFLSKGYDQVKSAARALKFLYWWILRIGYQLKLLSIREIPVIINNFNRLNYLLRLIGFLEKNGFTNIIILDNNSSYPPLLKFYENCKHRIVRENSNYGHLAFWKSGLYNKYKWNYFVYTDPDVLPLDECPGDFMQHFKLILDGNYRLDKVGFGIKIDDLPDSFSLRDKVRAYEKRYWEKEVGPSIFDAPIDTTFALYKPLSNLKRGEIYTLSAFRLGFPYLIRHLPWYVDSHHISEEERYYLESANRSSSMGKEEKGDKPVY